MNKKRTGIFLALIALPLAGGIMVATLGRVAGQETLWTRQFGTTGDDVATDIAVDAAGNSYVVGWTQGVLPGQSGLGDRDAFVRKYDGHGNALWTHQFGTLESDFSEGVALNRTGDLYVVGWTAGSLPGQAAQGLGDGYIRKYDGDGVELWTRQIGTGRFDRADGVATDGAGGVYMVGSTEGTFSGNAPTGERDPFLMKFDVSGKVLWTRQFGPGPFVINRALDVRTSPAGGAYVVGWTGGSLPGESVPGDSHVYLHKFDRGGVEMWGRQFSAGGSGFAYAVEVGW